MDLGAGQGASSWFLLREGFQVTAVDGSRTALAKAREWIGREGFVLDTTTSCLTELPFEGDSFDLVVDIVSSAHNTFNDMELIFAEVGRVLKPGGSFFSFTPTKRSAQLPFSKFGTITFLDVNGIDCLCRRGGLNLINTSLTSNHLASSDYSMIEHWIITAEK